jgi:hypothetical protein
MELDELIKTYRECGAVVAKLSLENDYEYSFVDICEEEPAMLEIFNIPAKNWVYYMERHPEYKHLCDFSKFTLLHWLDLIDRNSEFIDDVDFFSYSESEYDNVEAQKLLRRIPQYESKLATKLPLKYLGKDDTFTLLRYNRAMAQYCNQAIVESLQKQLADHDAEQAEFDLANEEMSKAIDDSATN